MSEVNRGAWHGDRALKDRTIEALKLDREKDAFIQGEYLQKLGTDHRGCSK